MTTVAGTSLVRSPEIGVLYTFALVAALVSQNGASADAVCRLAAVPATNLTVLTSASGLLEHCSGGCIVGGVSCQRPSLKSSAYAIPVFCWRFSLTSCAAAATHPVASHADRNAHHSDLLGRARVTGNPLSVWL